MGSAKLAASFCETVVPSIKKGVVVSTCVTAKVSERPVASEAVSNVGYNAYTLSKVEIQPNADPPLREVGFKENPVSPNNSYCSSVVAFPGVQVNTCESPARPAEPVLPVLPVEPVLPVGPVAPVIPVGPVLPVGPINWVSSVISPDYV